MPDSQSENLFRQNAIDALATKIDGRPVAVIPRPWLWLTLVCAAFVAVAACFLVTADYARKETVRGWLVSSLGVVSLSNSEYATVATIARNAGDVVRRGDPVVVLSEAVIEGEGQSPAAEVLRQLRNQLSATQRREALIREQFVADYSALDDQVRGLDDEMHAVAVQRRAQDVRVQRKAELQAGLKEAFARGAIAEIELRRRGDDLLVLQQSVMRLRQGSNSLDRERQGLLAAQDRLGTEFEQSIARLDALRGELRQRIAAHERQRSLVLHSPVDGTVATIEVVPGSTVRPQQTLVSIIPEQAVLVAEVYVPSRAAGMIEPGQPVRLLYDAFPHQQFGAANGTVATVAGFVSLPADRPAASGIREAAYKVSIRLASDHVEHGSARYALRPGMALAAEIILENRSLGEWLLAPLLARL